MQRLKFCSPSILGAISAIVALVAPRAFAQDFPEVAYEYRVPCELGGYKGFTLDDSVLYEMHVDSYGGAGRIYLQNSISYPIQDAGQCFLSTAYTFAELKVQIETVEQKIKEIENQRDQEIEPIDQRVNALNAEYDRAAEASNVAYDEYSNKSSQAQVLAEEKISKVYENLDKALLEFEKSCNETSLTKLPLASALAKIDAIIESAVAKVDIALPQILSADSEKFEAQISAAKRYFTVEKQTLLSQIIIARKIRDLLQKKAQLVLNFANRKKEVASALVPFQTRFQHSMTTAYQVNSGKGLLRDLEQSARNFQVDLSQKVCRFTVQIDAKPNTHDFRFYFEERPSTCRCEFIPALAAFDCYHPLGSTNVSDDVCHLLGMDYSARRDECIQTLDNAKRYGDLSKISDTQWIVNQWKDLRVYRYRIEEAKGIKLENYVDQNPPRVRVKEHSIK